MNIPDEVLKWLKENTYAAKDNNFWFIRDFPQNEMPDRLHIPMNKRLWQQIRDRLGM